MKAGSGDITGQALPMANLAEELSNQLGRPVMDKTGLTGPYDFSLRWTPDEGQPSQGIDGGPLPNNPPPPESSGPSIFTAIQEQLGLKLESKKGPVDVLVIDHVEKPSGN
jgi:uncharacterized protein (TIGR03435 family)